MRRKSKDIKLYSDTTTIAAKMKSDQQNYDLNHFVQSVDSIFGESIESNKTPYWAKGPPLVLGAKSDKNSLKTLKQKCHLGLPPQLRCAIWTASVVRVANPHQPIQISDSYGTVGKQKSINAGWNTVLNVVFPNALDIDDAVAPDLGLTQEVLSELIKNDYCKFKNGVASPEGGKQALTRVLCAVQQILGIEYCPLVPDIATVLLTHMPESYAYATIREMINDTSHFLPVCQKDYYSWCKTYYFFVKKMFPHAHKAMDLCGALTVEGLDPIFKRFFKTILKPDDVLHFMDIFLLEGCKAIFRLALSLAALIPKKEMNSMIFTDSESWWAEIRKRTLHPTFSFQRHLDKMIYPKFGKVMKRYPKRRVLGRVIRYNEKWAMANMLIYIDNTPPKPIGLLSDKPVILAKPTSVRSNLAKWLPVSLKSTKLDLIYSTESDGRSLSAFYNKCHRSKHTIVLVEAITDLSSITIGMFASQAWNTNPRPYGDGECFLFRADPDGKCFNWMPDFSGGFDDIENQTIREQFMVARSDFIAMGANTDGTNGLRLDQDLIHGESYPALGFGNEPLVGGKYKSFDIGTVEVYRLMREVDGKAIDGEDKLVWDLEGL